MTSRERMLAAYRRQVPDRVPVSPEIWDAATLAVSGRPYYELFGPFAEVPWWQSHLKAFEYFDCDAWIVPAVGPSPRQTQMRSARSYFTETNKATIRTDYTYHTSRGQLQAVAMTTRDYADWLIDHPVKQFPEDMERYAEYFFADPANRDLSEIQAAIDGVGEKGLVTPFIGSPFTSFLAAVREGSLVQTIYDLDEHEDYCRSLFERYVAYVRELTCTILDKTRTEALFVESGYTSPPMVSPALFRRWDKPVLAAIVEECKRKNVPVHIHQHGYVLSIIEDLIDAGISLVCPLIPPPQGDVTDLAAVKRTYGRRIALKGNIDPIEVLLKKTPRQIEEAVKACLEAAAPGGGFILGTADSTIIGTPFENIHAMVEAGKQYGRYPEFEREKTP